MAGGSALTRAGRGAAFDGLVTALGVGADVDPSRASSSALALSATVPGGC